MDTITVKIPTELNNLLTKMSKQEDRSKSSMIRIALQEYLEDLYDAKIGEEAYNRWLKNGKKSVSFKEILKENNITLEDLKED